MALLQRTRILGNQRQDRPDYNNIEDFVCADFKAIQRHVWTEGNFVYRGFEATGTGTTDLDIVLAGSACTISADDGELFIGASSLSPLTTSALTPSATNFVEISIDRDSGGADSRAFWDPTAAGGVGAEFSQIVDTFIFTKAVLNINTSSFTGDADKINICEVDVNGSGVITEIRDSRDDFWRLGRASDVSFDFSWSSRTEPATTSFTGADKDIDTFKKWADAVMSRIRENSGISFWYENPGVSLTGGFLNAGLSVLSALTATAKFAWSGTALSITDDSGGPANDDLAAVRLLSSSADLELTRQDGTGGTSTISIADGEVLWVEIPDPLASRTYSAVGLLSTNYRVSARASVPLQDTTYWLAYREGSNLYVRGLGELEPGETAEVSDNLNENILSAIGLASETALPAYSSSIRGVASENLISRIGTLTDAVGDEQEDRSAYIRSDDTVTWTGTQLEFTTDIVLEIINTKSGTITTHSIPLASSPIAVANGESLYFEIDRTAASETPTVVNSGVTPIPAQTQGDKDIFVLFRRNDALGIAYLHLPLHKQVISEGQSLILGTSGSGTGSIKVDLFDPISTVLPTGVSVITDGITGVNGDLVLFSNLLSDNNRVYELSGVGVAIAWTAQRSFSNDFDPTDGDTARVLRGDGFQDQLAVFSGTAWAVNETVRFFDGADFWELSSIKTSTLTDATTASVFEVAVAGSENFILSYSITRAATKETGEIFITSDGTSADVVRTNSFLGDVGVEFTADVMAGDLRLRYTTTSTGSDATMKYFTKRWSNTAGGPTGIPNYTAFTGSPVAAAGSVEDVQFHGSSGNLDASTKFKWDSVTDALDLNGLEIQALIGPATINDNQVALADLITYDAATFRFVIIEYSIERGTDFRVGRLLVTNDGSSASISDDFVETGVTGVTLSAIISGSDVKIQYTSTSTGSSGSFKHSARRWA